MAYTIATLIEKGGVGKTTTAIHLAHAFALAGVRSVIVDLDPQANATQWVGPDSRPPTSIFEVLQQPEQGIARAIVPSVIENVGIVCGARALGMAERILSTASDGAPRNPMTVLRRALRDVPVEYDLAIIDCPPSVGILNTNAIVAAQRLVIPVDPSELTYEGFANVALTLSQLVNNEILETIPALSVLFTKVDPRLRVARRISERIKAAEAQPYVFFERAIRERVIMRDLPSDKKTAFQVDAARDIADDYTAVGRELEGLLTTIRAPRAVLSGQP